jgi:hypothetical protein
MKMNEFIVYGYVVGMLTALYESGNQEVSLEVEYTTCPIKLIKSSVHMHSNPLQSMAIYK